MQSEGSLPESEAQSCRWSSCRYALCHRNVVFPLVLCAGVYKPTLWVQTHQRYFSFRCFHQCDALTLESEKVLTGDLKVIHNSIFKWVNPLSLRLSTYFWIGCNNTAPSHVPSFTLISVETAAATYHYTDPLKSLITTFQFPHTANLTVSFLCNIVVESRQWLVPCILSELIKRNINCGLILMKILNK